MDEIKLAVTKREVLGKKVRFLRRQGVTPVHLFGHGIESLALQCDTAQLQRVSKESCYMHRKVLRYPCIRMPCRHA